MLTLAVVDPAVFRGTSVKAPGGIELARKSVVEVTPVSCAAVQVGMLSLLTGIGAEAETFRTVQSVAAVLVALGLQTGSAATDWTVRNVSASAPIRRRGAGRARVADRLAERNGHEVAGRGLATS